MNQNGQSEADSWWKTLSCSSGCAGRAEVKRCRRVCNTNSEYDVVQELHYAIWRKDELKQKDLTVYRMKNAQWCDLEMRTTEPGKAHSCSTEYLIINQQLALELKRLTHIGLKIALSSVLFQHLSTWSTSDLWKASNIDLNLQFSLMLSRDW